MRTYEEIRKETTDYFDMTIEEFEKQTIPTKHLLVFSTGLKEFCEELNDLYKQILGDE